MTSNNGSIHQFAIGAGPPVIEERLDLTLIDGYIKGQRMTPENSEGSVMFPLPPDKAMENYRRALGKTAALQDRPDEATSRQINELISPIREALLRAVPEPMRRRMATEGAGQTRNLITIELTLLDSGLEKYPWELIADPSSLCGGATDIIVWRSIQFPFDPPVRKRWTNNLLITGTAAMLRVTPFIHDELAWIKNELNDYHDIQVFCHPGVTPNIRRLLKEHHPVVFHLVAHATSSSIQFQARPGPTLKELQIDPRFVATDLGRSGVWMAVFNCCDSATSPSYDRRPPAYEIAERSGAATIGMAGLIQPYIGGLFATTFYRCLARGFSAVQAYHEAICCIRDHDTYSTMWSIPVMYATTTNVIPFPIDDQARRRLDFEQMRLQVKALDRELQTLVRGNYHRPGEWAKQTAVPLQRTACIGSCLTAATVIRTAATPDERRRRYYITDARHEFRSALHATATSLSRLSALSVGAAERRKALRELSIHRARHKRIFETLDELFNEMC